MPTLDELMNLPGVIAAGKFDDSGNVVEFKGDLSQEEAGMAALMAVANKMVGELEARGFEAFTGKKGFSPIQGFAVSAGKFVACIANGFGVIFEADKADFDKAFQVLMS